MSISIEGAEGADGPGDEAAAERVASTLLHLLLCLSALPNLRDSGARIQLVELQLMETVAPALMHHLATAGGQPLVSCCAGWQETA